MPAKTITTEYETIVVGAAYLVKNILSKLGFVSAIDAELTHQPEIEATYGHLAQAIVANRLTFQPAPLYALSEWAVAQGIDQVFELEASWLDDDRLGSMLEALAAHQVSIWSTIVKNAVRRFHIDLAQLHSDTTSVYFEGKYEDENGQALGGGEGVPLMVEGYNKDGQRNKVQFVLSMVVSQRVPLWYRPWDGNQTDEPVYVADWRALREAVLLPETSLLIGDRKLCTEDTMRTFCRQKQWFLAPHPWTDTAKAVWWRTWHHLQAGGQHWETVEYVSRNNARKPPEKRPQYRVCEVVHLLEDPEHSPGHPLRWMFVWSSDKAQQDARQRQKALQAGQEALQRIVGLLGKYDYTSRKTIEARLDKRAPSGRHYFPTSSASAASPITTSRAASTSSADHVTRLIRASYIRRRKCATAALNATPSTSSSASPTTPPTLATAL